jgi:hypothetical protein
MYKVNGMMWKVMLIFVLSAILILPNAFAKNGKNQISGWIEEVNASFEADFPTEGWTSTVEAGSANYSWGRSNYTATDGNYSIWCASKNLAGAPKIYPSGNYANNMSAYAVLGPINLQYCTQATLTLDLWYLISDADRVHILADIGNGWQGVQFTGNSGGWTHQEFDLAAWPGIGNMLGEPDVYIAFRFYSNGASAATGAFVDNVKLNKFFTGWPDEVLDEVIFDTDAHVQGSPFTLSATVSNNGENPSPRSYVQFFLSQDNVIDPTVDLVLGSVDVPNLDVGMSNTVTGVFNTPISLAPGYYYVGAAVDYNDYITEGNEGNNMVVTGSADFLLTAFSGWDVVCNEVITADFPIGLWSRNPGAGNYQWGRSSYRVFEGTYSMWCTGGNANGAPNVYPHNGYANNADSWAVYGPFDLINCQKADVSFVFSQKVVNMMDRLRVLISTGSGWQGYTFEGNTDGWLYEQLSLMAWPGLGSLKDMSNLRIAFNFSSDNTGNALEGTFVDKIVLRRQFIMPDLVCPVTVDPMMAQPGGELDVTTIVRNQGSDISGESKVDIYMSADATITSGDILVATHLVPSLEVGDEVTFDDTAVLGNDLSDGPYYVGALVDGDNTVEENSEVNNTSSAQVTVVIPKPDLTCTIVSVQSPNAQSIETKVTISNTGDAASAATTLKYMLTAGTVADVGVLDIDAIDAGSSKDYSKTWSLASALATGQYTLSVMVDPDNGVTEENEDNNEDSEDFNAVNTSVAQVIPAEFELQQNYPNPFNPQTSIQYSLPKTCEVQLTIHNVHGQIIRTLVNQTMEAGAHEAVWDGSNQYGEKAASGVYFYQIEAGSFKAMRKMILLQ